MCGHAFLRSLLIHVTVACLPMTISSSHKIPFGSLSSPVVFMEARKYPPLGTRRSTCAATLVNECMGGNGYFYSNGCPPGATRCRSSCWHEMDNGPDFGKQCFIDDGRAFRSKLIRHWWTEELPNNTFKSVTVACLNWMNQILRFLMAIVWERPNPL